MDNAITEIRYRQNLWNNMEEWETNLHIWTHSEFNTLNVEDMNNINTKIIKNCLQFEKYLPENNIVPVLRQSAEEFKLKLPVIGYLRNQNFKAVSFANFFILIAFAENLKFSASLDRN